MNSEFPLAVYGHLYLELDHLFEGALLFGSLSLNEKPQINCVCLHRLHTRYLLGVIYVISLRIVPAPPSSLLAKLVFSP